MNQLWVKRNMKATRYVIRAYVGRDKGEAGKVPYEGLTQKNLEVSQQHATQMKFDRSFKVWKKALT